MRASVVIRARDKETELARTLAALDAQSERGFEVILVDNGSRDATVGVARAAGAEVVEIPREDFSYGGALNVGAELAQAAVVVALSAHSRPTDREWLARLLAVMDGERVACASGQDRGPDGVPLREPFVLEGTAWPFYGYSNHAGAFRTALWRERPFRADLPYCEDREWAWHWLQHGWRVVIDPALIVEHSHGWAPLGEQYRRQRLMWEAYGMYLPVAPLGVRGLVAQWWRDQEGYASPLRARVSRSRLARLAGAYAGRRAASARS
jgi:rhamnosyltransferase